MHLILPFLILLMLTDSELSPETKITPTSIVWQETSGPVAPEFRYSVIVRIQADAKGFFFAKKETKGNHPATEVKKKISKDSYSKFITQLIQSGALEHPYENLPTEKITGISYNSFSIQRGSKKSRFFYVLKDLEKAEFKKKKRIIDQIKGIRL
ncbi:hypothetical protein EHS15_10440 [Leptospira idonii]|uniref:Uncharacterized protein n=1 Tax=Leptospira idonii TaxID=1193500 RepID=A0A4R9LZD0_9LEPT|nr:hypothetical protein EHS15_10440 [Leptospira idonii]